MENCMYCKVSSSSKPALSLWKGHLKEITKFLNCQLQQIKPLNWNPNVPSFCYCCKAPGHWKRNCHTFSHFSPLTSMSNISTILNDRDLRNYL